MACNDELLFKESMRIEEESMSICWRKKYLTELLSK